MTSGKGQAEHLKVNWSLDARRETSEAVWSRITIAEYE
jgi:hypothetical protein